MHDDGCGISAPPAGPVFRASEEGLGLLFPFAVVTALAAVRPLRVEPLLAVTVPRLGLCAAFTVMMNATAKTADARSADRHDQSTGAMRGLPSTKIAEAAIDVPPVFVITARMYRFLPMYPSM